MLNLRSKTSPAWLEAVFADFDSFLVDHAACERKASATGISFVVRFSDRTALIEPLIEFAREELEHFQRVYRVMAARGLELAPDYKDAYVNGLQQHVRNGEPHLLDRLLVAGIVEARGCERLCLVHDALPEGETALRELYLDLGRAEARHHALFFRLAKIYYDEGAVEKRAVELLDAEAELVLRLPHLARVH